MNAVLALQGKTHLLLNQDDFDNMQLIGDLLMPFQEATEYLSGENYVTISVVVPFFAKLKQHLAAEDTDNQMIKDMKKHMLIKLNNRYTKSQENLLSICSLMDIRYK